MAERAKRQKGRRKGRKYIKGERKALETRGEGRGGETGRQAVRAGR
jgi:hypothetical protein